ncbi:carbohydrate binding family 9 domain-containing protein [Psychroserpens sp. SPM9]|uniref:carbohydrate binding family 9 domain-containing protein n=1 Tax=Psychroserpens sp. SPM9 TaxID=2975598 RepID=UPI0021A7D2D3|nr:carbohydrate binding family 9 domain-containing protein [Psychroserpens sp. SPM9]MDG5491923.1 carbohydrate binding family 9 domain-containing protein [Psychroserpens sp. SPM9]
MTFRLILITLLLLFSFFANAQEKKQLQIERTNTPPKIDGILDDAVWQTAKEAKGFTQFRPDAGVKDSTENRTIVKMTYDDKAIYVAAYLYDDPSKIMRQLTSRDNFGQADFFGLILNPNNDAQNDTEFFVFSSGTQADAVATPSNGEDFGWNAVWDSAVKINDDGWTVEMEIPYRALRFSNQEVQTWGVQFHRQFRRYRSQYTWNAIDITKGNIGLYHGEITGLKNIEPPTRLAFYPFSTGIVNSFDGDTETDLKFGLDVKYGITENFTLDMTLVPDFSQAGFDNLSLNLGPFEQTFSEQRQFFTEGVDLFNKGNLFFSRRVGSRPTGQITVNDNEVITDRPNTVKVLNAAKVSGRTKKGLGIGFFNAITEKTYATTRDTITGEYRDQLVEPLSNYNILVLDQQFNQNSSVSLVNTNVTRNGHFRDGNVTALLADITNKRNTYNLLGEVKMSNINDIDDNSTGFSTFFMARKIHGNYRYSFDHSYADTKYDINDLGLIFRNNYNNFGVDFGHRIFEPTKNFISRNWNTYINYTRLADPSVFTGFGFGGNINFQLKDKLHGFGGNINMLAGKQYDYFEARVNNRFFIYENRVNGNVYFSSNYNKVFAYDINTGGVLFFENGRDTKEFWIGLSPRARISDKFSLIYSFDINRVFKDRGYANNSNSLDDEIVFGQRDQSTIVNRLTGTYSFNPFHSLGLTFRNYWSVVDYEDDVYFLQENGRLFNTNTTYADLGLETSDVNFSTWNLDLNYTWQFAPGSFLTALYRNQLFNSDREASKTYSESVNTLFEQPILHSFSLRVQYFIDYNNIKRIFKKKNNESNQLSSVSKKINSQFYKS